MSKSILLSSFVVAASLVSFAASEKPATFRYATWNIGHYSCGRSKVSTVPVAKVESCGAAYREFLGRVQADWIGVCEYGAKFDVEETSEAAQVIFGQYPVQSIGPSQNYQWNAAFANGRFKILDTVTKYYTNHCQNVYYLAHHVMIDGRDDAWFVQTHLDWQSSDARVSQIRELVSDFSDKPRVVISGDFNAAEKNEKGVKETKWSDYAILRDAGFTVSAANRDFTCPQSNPYLVLDVLAMRGFSIEKKQIYDVAALSDHNLLMCELRIQREVGPENVPDLLTTFDGRKVTTKEMWEKVRRPELLKCFEERVYGVRPEEKPRSLSFAALGEDEPILSGLGVRRRVRAIYEGPLGTNSFDFVVYLPTTATAENPAPAFVMICLSKTTFEYDPESGEEIREQWPIAEILRRGYATAGFHKEQLSPDREHGNLLGVFSVYEEPVEYRSSHRWGTLSAWAWGASRVLDYLETEKRIDARRVGVVGHSRGGKTAILTGATDPRFALVCSNDSGCSGAKLNHIDIARSEHIVQIVRTFPYWFCPEYVFCVNREFELDFDQHEFLALIAPRLLCVASATDDPWAGPRGEFESARLASPAWELYGLKGLDATDFPAPNEPIMRGNVEYHLRKGPHRISDYDWKCYLDFADLRMKNNQSSTQRNDAL